MKFRYAGVLAAALLGACGTDASGPAGKAVGVAGEEQGGVSGRILAFTPGPDSSVASVAGAEVTLVRVGPLPDDGSPGDSGSTPPPPGGGTTPPPSDTLFFRQAGFGALDTLITPPVDPPPPPPPVNCGRTGETVATATTDDQGNFSVTALEPAVYDIQVSPAEGSGLGAGLYCGLNVRSGDATPIDLYLQHTD